MATNTSGYQHKQDSAANVSRDDFAQILWIGGPPDSGKTTIAQRLAERHGCQVYHFDRHEPAHFARCDPALHPTLYTAHPDRMTPERRWLGQPPAIMAEETIACWTERCAMALDDLRAMPTTTPIIAEGPGFFPTLIAPLLADTRQAIWLVPTESFKRASVARRRKLHGVPVSDPAQAVENLITRDLLLCAYVTRQVQEQGLTMLTIDEMTDLEEVLAKVEPHFAAYLPSAK